MQSLCADNDLCPKIMEAWFCEKGAAIVMEALDETAGALFNKYKSVRVRMIILGSVMGLLNRLHALGIAHGDSHLSNVMVKETPMTLGYKMSYEGQRDLAKSGEYGEYIIKRYRYYFIDMGQSMKSSKLDVLLRDYSELQRAFRHEPVYEVYDDFLEAFIKMSREELKIKHWTD